MSTMPETKPKKPRVPVPKRPDLSGIGEISSMFGESPQLAHKWTQSKRFPAPAYVLSAGRFWLTDDVVAWALEHRPHDAAKKLDPKVVRRVKKARGIKAPPKPKAKAKT